MYFIFLQTEALWYQWSECWRFPFVLKTYPNSNLIPNHLSVFKCDVRRQHNNLQDCTYGERPQDPSHTQRCDDASHLLGQSQSRPPACLTSFSDRQPTTHHLSLTLPPPSSVSIRSDLYLTVYSRHVSLHIYLKAHFPSLVLIKYDILS